MANLTKEEIKKKIEELAEQRSKISNEIFKLQQMNEGYWIGKVYYDDEIMYYRLGFRTETEAEEYMAKITSETYCYGYYGYDVE